MFGSPSSGPRARDTEKPPRPSRAPIFVKYFVILERFSFPQK